MRTLLRTALLLSLFIPLAVQPAYGQQTDGILGANEWLDPGDSLRSGTGEYILILQQDGNLALYDVNHLAIWQTYTAGNPDAALTMQGDGNLVLYAPGNVPIWESGTAGHPDTGLFVQDDGNLVLYAPGNVPIWESGTGPAVSTPSLADDFTDEETEARKVGLEDLSKPECNNLRMGVSGWCVVALQVSLNYAGYRVDTDGEFGAGTDAVVRLLQRDGGVTVDGIIGSEERYLLAAFADQEQAKRNIVDGEDEIIDQTVVCEFAGPLGFACEHILTPEPAG